VHVLGDDVSLSRGHPHGQSGLVSGMVLLPGMGADARLFQAQSAFLKFEVPGWPEPSPGDSLRTYAARVVVRLSGQTSVIGGASFGGLVALDMAAVARPQPYGLGGSGPPA